MHLSWKGVFYFALNSFFMQGKFIFPQHFSQRKSFCSYEPCVIPRFVSIGTFPHITTRTVLYQRYSDDDDDDDDNWYYGNDNIIELAKEILDDLESSEISSEFSNHIFQTIQRMKSDLNNPHVETYEHMGLDLDMLLAICKASTWFTTKQRNLLGMKS